jgi:hypothetical protein
MKDFNGNTYPYFYLMAELISAPKSPMLESKSASSKDRIHIHVQRWLKSQEELKSRPKYISLAYQRKEDFKDIFKKMAEAGWSIPVQLPLINLIRLKEIDYCSNDIDDTLTFFYTNDKNQNLRELIDIIISEEEDNEWIQPIKECYESFDSDRFTCIVPCLMAIVEGYLAKKIETYKTQNVKLQEPTKNKVKAVDTKNPDYALSYLGRYSVLLVIENLFQKSDFSEAVPTSMNRHWIMHGRKISFNPKTDALKLFNLIGSISMPFYGIEDLIDYSDSNSCHWI